MTVLEAPAHDPLLDPVQEVPPIADDIAEWVAAGATLKEARGIHKFYPSTHSTERLANAVAAFRKHLGLTPQPTTRRVNR